MTEHGVPNSAIVWRLMFDYEDISCDEICELCKQLPNKIVRWIAMNHPDNRTRLLFYQATGVRIGKDSVLNAGVVIYDDYQGYVTFGSRIAVATGVSFVASSNPNNSSLANLRYVREHLISFKPIVVEDDAWIGTNAVILPGVTIGRGAVIGAGAVVTRNVPSYSVIGGVPGKTLRQLDSELQSDSA
jgi:acetyltransferase-like isoleucine patch superfamily enzyme